MKPIRRTDSTSRSCSCTSCIYKSESEQSSLKKYIAHGSKIDRLYYGKYIPLRERKLLNRLVRTRAVYDDLRARLISDSTLSLSKNADLRPRKHHHAIKTLDTAAENGAILELVDYIDKRVLGPKKLSECCSCCSCSSKTEITDSDRKVHRYKRPHMRGLKKQYAERLHGRAGERYHKRGVWFKAKQIRSEPCTCTFKFSGLIKKHSKVMLRKLRPAPLEPLRTEELSVHESKLQNFARKSYQKYKNLQDKLDQDIRKLNESKENLIESLQLRTKKSLQQMKQVKDKVKSNIESGVQKSIQAAKALNPKERDSEQYEEGETGFKIKKDSIIKFKDFLKRKELMKEWECDFECEPDTCVPEECFKIIKLKRVRRRNRQRVQKPMYTDYQKIKRDIYVGDTTSKKTSNSSVQAENLAVTTATPSKKPMLRIEEGNKVMGQRYIFETKEVKKNMKQGDKDTAKLQKQREKSVELRPSSLITAREEKIFRNAKKTSKGMHKALKHNESLMKKHQSGSRQAVRVGSSFSFNLEFYKTKLDPESSHIANEHSDIKYVTKPKYKKVRGLHKGSQLLLNPTLEGKHSPLKEVQIKLGKHHSAVKTNTSYSTKSVSSITKPATANKNISKGFKHKDYSSQASLIKMNEKWIVKEPISSSHKQAVRIGSTFSFNVEFYKKDLTKDVKKSSIIEKAEQNRNKSSNLKKMNIRQTQNKRNYYTHKGVRSKVFTVKDKYKEAKANFTQCMCWPKLHKFGKPKKKINTSTTGSTTSYLLERRELIPSKIHKNVETVKNSRHGFIKKIKLLPYECEPGVCIPGKCDPIQCNKIIKLRNKKQNYRISKVSHTSSRKTKSRSSAVSTSISPVKAKIVQSSPVPTKLHKILKMNKDNFFIPEYNLSNTKSVIPGRQVVRIGSSFSFNIEFYKNKQIPKNSESLSNVPKLINHSKSINEEEIYVKDIRNKNNKTVLAPVVNLDKNIGPTLKRCFCNLKLYKNKDRKKFRTEKVKTAITQTFGEGVSIVETVNKGTRTKLIHAYKLLPYECEPYFCVPGECDPVICFENIKRRAINTREYGISTDKPNMGTISSLTENTYQRSTASLAQPKLFRKGTNIRKKHLYVENLRPRELSRHAGGSGESFSYTNSKHVARIGSSFNFNIEFSKKVPETVTSNKQYKFKNASEGISKIYGNKGIKVKKVHDQHVNAQPQQARKVHRSSLVRPILKRCFCTLNLQKNIKQRTNQGNSGSYNFSPKMYTVSRAMTNINKNPHYNIDTDGKTREIGRKKRMLSVSTSSFLFKKLIESAVSKYSTLKLGPPTRVPIAITQPINISSNLSVEVQFIRNFYPFGSYDIKRPIKSLSSTYRNTKPQGYLSTINEQYGHNKLPSVGEYFDQCFCTMNVQISHEKPGRKYFISNLKPYECEPGICTPDKCNPYECQKLIMKRFMRHANKGSNAQVNNQSVSSYAPQMESDSRSTQFKTSVPKHSQVLKAKQNKPQKQLREGKQRQIIRVGSSFSFDVVFSKNHLPEKIQKLEESYRHHKMPAKRIKYLTSSKGVQETTFSGKNRQLQTKKTSVHKASNYIPTTKKCFCTLKLQKKGRIHQPNVLSKPPRTGPVSNVSSRNIKVATKSNYIPKLDSNHLKFYECEPGICIPDHCNPYKCLEIMKKRKDFGTTTTRLSAKSISSMASERGRKHKIQAVYVKPGKLNKKTTGINKDFISIKSSNTHISGRQPRQAVRIGSNFSFSVEFIKDKPYGLHEVSKNYNNFKDLKPITRDVKEKKSVTQSRIRVNNRDTQIKSAADDVSTMTTSFIKRCFCSTKLRDKNPEQANTTTFKQKCFCLLGLQKRRQSVVQPADNIVPTANKRINTNNKPKVYTPLLETYECEPGICIPGQCDPYLCHKIIQKRTAKQYSKTSETESVKTQSISSSSSYVKKPKHEGTQSFIEKQNKHMSHVRKERKPEPKSTENTDRHLVRIGSSFDFNVEFFKDFHHNNTEVKGRRNEVNHVRNVRLSKANENNHMKSISTEPSGPSVHIKSQSEKKEMKTFGISPLIKRCFCTLKLLRTQNNLEKKINKTDKGNVITKKSIKTQSHRLLERQPDNVYREGDVLSSYECEPFICIPGECNPIECLERIKGRQKRMKSFGTVTGYPKRKSFGSVSARTKDVNLQAKLIPTPNKFVQNANYIEDSKLITPRDRSRQAVRIGSNFSFNIEFSKDACKAVSNKLPDLKIKKQPKVFNKKLHNKTITPSYFTRSVNSQATAKNVKSTDTEMPHLKRCFCTLQLQNNNVPKYEDLSMEKQTKPKSEHSVVGQFLKSCICALKISKVGKLQNEQLKPAMKYEIKGTSTYNRNALPERNLKSIRLLKSYECEPNICIPGECDPYECLKRIQTRQVRDFGTKYKHNLKDFAADSIKQPVTKCKGAQYPQNRKNHAQSTSVPSKRKEHSKVVTQHLSHPSDNAYRQAVRIGSNFSFNIEFFKERGPADRKEYEEFKRKNAQKLETGFKKQRTRSRGLATARKNLRCQRSQCPFLKRGSSNMASTLPKRCFCTLSLLKANNDKVEGKTLKSFKLTEDKMTITQNKYMSHELGVYECPPQICIPGECDPYECLNKMKRKGILQKQSRYAGAQVMKTSIASGGNKLQSGDRKIQAGINKRDSVSLITNYKPKTRNIHKIYNLNKSAVRIGSNFNFSIEFYKQKSQPAIIRNHKILRGRHKEKNSKFYKNNSVAAKREKLQHRNLQANKVKTKDQASDAGKTLKRCFCTLQIQKQQRNIFQENKPSAINLRYPQIVTVGRAEVHPFNKIIAGTKRNGKVSKVKSTLSDPKLLHNTRTVATKTNKKYVHSKGLNLLQCDPTNCPEYKRFLGKRNKSTMETILPYTPSKFNKKESKALISDKVKLKKVHENNEPIIKNDLNLHEKTLLQKGRILTARISKKSRSNELNKICSFNESVLSRCARFFSKETKSVSKPIQEKQYNIEKKPPQVKLTVIPKNKKNNVARTMGNENCPDLCPDYVDLLRNKYGSKLESGDAGRNIVKSQDTKVKVSKNKQIKSEEKEKPHSDQPKMKVTFADSTEHLSTNYSKRKVRNSLHHKSSMRNICYSCSVNDCPLKSDLGKKTEKDQEKTGVFSLFANCLKKSGKKTITYSESADNCQYCECCKRKLHVDEISKGAGDRSLSVSFQNKKLLGCPCGKNSVNGEEKIGSFQEKTEPQRIKKYGLKKDKCCIAKQTSKEILNDPNVSKEPTQNQANKYKFKHGNLCKCCKCIEKRKIQGAKILVSAKGTSNITGTFGKLLSGKKVQEQKVQLSINPCICGSKTCAKESKKKRMKPKDKVTIGKPCICGSPICTRESKKMRRKKELVCKCEETIAKRILQKQKRKDLDRRLKIEEAKDEIRRLKRMKRNKKLERRVKKYKNASDFILVTDSLIDVGKLGVSAVTGTLRATTKALSDPKLAYERMKCQKYDQETLMKRLEKKYTESDAAATGKRLKIRCLFMKSVKSVRTKLEENPLTHFLLHLADEDPKTRKFKRKPKRPVRRREPLDFNCSLYMASLRKRPYLYIYYKCPWFYPHFITMLNIWKQFTDIMLFLLAAVVWSPCILCMEGCRALLCCFFCTG